MLYRAVSSVAKFLNIKLHKKLFTNCYASIKKELNIF